MFVGRKQELIELERLYGTEKPEFILLSGKRRIGKSQLIVASHKDFDGIVISYECFVSTYSANLEMLEAEIEKVLGDRFSHFQSLYEVILYLHAAAKERKVLFVLDEYPYMREGDSTDGEIKNAIDAINKMDAQNPFKMIICGSAIDVMNMMDESNKPLHGRFTSKMAIGPLNYLESSLFYPDASLEDKVNYYSVLGGVPYYLKQIDGSRSFNENMIRLFFSSSPLLKTELQSQVSKEISKIEKAPFVLSIIKDRMSSYTDILQTFNQNYPEKSIDYVLDKLILINAIEKIYVRQNNGKSRPYYRIKDISLVFYYSFLNYLPGNPLLFTPEDYYATFVEGRLREKHIPSMFERVGFEFIALMNRKAMLGDRLLDLYPYVVNDRVSKRNYQFDVVGETEDGLINYECKYRKSPIEGSKVNVEERQAILSKENFKKTVFISRSEVLPEDVERYYLKDMFDSALLS